ncbi:MAG: pyruvate carboxyltransferase [Myxococcales bacterium]|nr:pyruvate carboxyltransferase [Myxococcales bacterium]
MTTQRVRVVDATLRDGSYCVNFQFTAADTAVLVSMLDAAGVGFIELGHGSGTFNHKAPPHLRSIRQAATDEAYLAAARKCATRAKLGVITGPFGTNDLGVLAAHKLDFVRLACMADRALDPANLKMAERAKALGLLFSVNLMQTVAITPSQVAEIAVEYSKAGADWFYVVDSSGGMLPSVVSEYIARVHDTVEMTIGFHAHHNSGLAIANCLAAIEAGATMVDGTLQGLGRDVGNAPTEQLLFMLQRRGDEREIDVEQVCHASDLVRGLLLDKGNDPTYIAAGASEIHSSNVEALVELARTRGLGPRTLLAAIGHGDIKLIGAGMKTFPDEILSPACARTPVWSEPNPRSEVIDVVADDIARASSRSLPVLADVLFSRAAKWHKTSVLHLVPRDQLPFEGPLPWDLDRLCGITIGVTRSDLDGIDFADRQPDVLVIDPALIVDPLPASMSSCVDAFLPVIVDSALALATLCLQAGARVWLLCSDEGTAAQLVARTERAQTGGTDRRLFVIGPDSEESLASVRAADNVIVVGHEELPPRVASLASRGARLLRPGLAASIAARISTLLDLRARLTNESSTANFVEPMFIPAGHQIIVDDPSCPSTVVGAQHGRAALLSAAKARARTLSCGRGRL